MAMGDARQEPSMEDILASIKRIIAEDHEASAGSPARPAPEPADLEPPRSGFANLHLVDNFRDPLVPSIVEVLELTQPIETPPIEAEGSDALEAEAPLAKAEGETAPAPSISELPANPEAQQEAIASAATAEVERAIAPPTHSPVATPSVPATIVSEVAASASRHSLAALSAMMVKPEPGADNTLEGLVREMLRPMLKDWLDQRLPELVETLVEREIARITGRMM